MTKKHAYKSLKTYLFVICYIIYRNYQNNVQLIDTTMFHSVHDFNEAFLCMMELRTVYTGNEYTLNLSTQMVLM